MDWAVELEEPAKFYQHCLPQTFRHINSVTDITEELTNLLHGERLETIDQWDVLHFQSMTGEWDEERAIYKNAGFSSIFDAERISEFDGYVEDPEEYPSTLGFFDEGYFHF
jgi:hypothetical protein